VSSLSSSHHPFLFLLSSLFRFLITGCFGRMAYVSTSGEISDDEPIFLLACEILLHDTKCWNAEGI
jgi:hypothetical protein